MSAIPDHLIVRLVIALAIGLVVGVERGWRERDSLPGQRTAGVRTYTLIAFLGALIGVLTQVLDSGLVFGFGFMTFAGVFAWFKMHEAQHDHDFSITGTVTGLIVFVLGAICIVGDAQIAAGSGVAVAGILASREHVHGWVERLTWAELRSALLLLAMTVIVLPVLPHNPVAVLGGINPREIWIFTVLTATISFAGYAAIKIAGASKGIVISALAGAVVSSTAVTVAFARRAAAGEPARMLAGGAALAGGVSLVRTAIVAMLLAPALLPLLAAPIAAAAVVFLLTGFFLVRDGNAAADNTSTIGNPFELKPLLLFALAFAAVSAISVWLTGRYGQSGIYLSSAVVGLLDVDVATLSAARLAGNSLSLEVAARAIFIALAVNAAARVLYGMLAGPAAFTVRLGLATLAALSAAAMALIVTG
ncbi:MAG: MgtC/SapB family protein [Beijerinckiaceae bacterium]